MIGNVDYVVCRICGEKRRLITGRHVNSHGYTMEQYRKEFPDAKLICDSSRMKNSTSRKNQAELNEKKEKLSREKPTSADYIKCEICGEFFREISNTHLNKHGLSVEEYKKRYPGAKLRGFSTQVSRDEISKVAVPRMNAKYRKLLKDPEFLKKKSLAQIRGYAKLASDHKRYAEYLKKCERGRFARRLTCSFDPKLLFRSRPEVELAEILHGENLPVLYEAFLLQMPDGRNYLPDFYVPSANLIIEVKGRDFYNEYCEYRMKECVEAGFNYEFIFDDEVVSKRFSEICSKYKLMI